MATTTPNIGLTLPIGTENVSRQIINDNNTKIDTAIGTLNSKITNVDHAKIVFVSASVTIPTIAANAYASANVDVDYPAGTNGIKTIVPRYTSAGIPIAGAYGVSGAPSGKQRITIGVYNVTGAALSNVSATIDVGFMY